MVFSIFGRKKGPVPPKRGEKGADDKNKPTRGPASSVSAKSTTPARPEATGSSRAGADAGNEISLDFSTYAPLPKAEPATDAIGSVMEQAAILFANGQSQEALALLSQSLHEAEPGESTLQTWSMLFDLYQHLGMREEFEALGLEFAVKFERSPPTWVESAPRPDPGLDTGGIGYFAVAGTLSGSSAAGIDKLRSAAEKQRSVRIDFGKLQGLDERGCGLLREALRSIRAAGTAIVLTGESQLTRLLEEACQPGRRDTGGEVWGLLLDVYRLLDDKEKFEETAVNYAVTFEVSPPSWDTQVKAAKRVAEEEPADPPERALVLSGEITGAEASLAKRLQDWASVYRVMVIDMSRVRRVDFVSAGLMLNVLSKLNQAGVTTRIQGVNALVQALFHVMRLDKVAQIVPRK